jgi:hypothetical protein
VLVSLQTAISAKELLIECLGEDGEVVPGRHFLEELAKEDLTFPDALYVLRHGCVTEPADQDIRTREWKYTIEGREPDGQWIRVIFSFKAINRAFLITIFSVRGS